MPKAFLRRLGERGRNIMSGQENVWLIIKQSFNAARNVASKHPDVKFVILFETEDEDLNYKLEWMKIIFRGTKEQELQEKEALEKFYLPFKKLFKKNLDLEHTDDDLKKRFSSKILTAADLDEAYEKGFGAVGDKSISDKLLEFGILTHIKLVEDYNNRLE